MTDTILTIEPDTVLGRLATLKPMPIAQLKQQWRELHGREPPVFGRRFIESRLAYRIQELAYGGLKPETVAKLEAIGEQLDGGNANTVTVRVPLAIRKRGGRKVVVSPDGSVLPTASRQVTIKADPALLKALRRAFRWKLLLDDGTYASVSDIARAG
jgi:hypothetical protein